MQTRSKRMKSGNYDMSVNLDLTGELLTGKTNPLQIPEITDHMFKFLKLSDIKNCRSVCQKWNQLAKKYLKKHSVVNILNPKCFQKFNAVFPKAQQSQLFSCFRFGDRMNEFKWPVYKFVAFFRKWNHSLSEITFSSGENYGLISSKVTCYDLSPLLPSTLTKLRITRFNPKIILSIDKVCNIRILQLENCILNIIPGTVLNNVEIDLEYITFRDGTEIDFFLINPLLNFEVLKNASFTGMNIQLDMQGSHSLDMLSFHDGVTILNWETSNWEIKKLFLGVYPGEEVEEQLSKSTIKYKELDIGLTHLNVSLLPEGTEKLQVELESGFGYDQSVPPRISGEHNFPDLKHLHITLRDGNDFSPFVEFFKHCPKLTVLTVSLCAPCHRDFRDSSEVILKTSSVPPSVKTLRVINDVRIIADCNLKLQLEFFNLYNAHDGEKSDVIVELAKEFNVNNLHWFGLDLEI